MSGSIKKLVTTAAIWRFVTRLLRLHPTSKPYISGDTFRSLANHIIDEYENADPKNIQEGNIVFVSSGKLEDFFTHTLPTIKCKFTLISHNGDRNITANDIVNIDGRITHWYAQNCLAKHPLLTPLPIGLENQRFYQHGDTSLFKKLQRLPQPQKKNRIIYKFNSQTNPAARKPALAALSTHPLSDTYTDWRPPLKYLETLREYAFVASPIGNGHDCIRTWEAFYLNTVPIVTRSVLTEYWESIGLPVYIIEDWDALEKISANDLEATYVKMLPKFSNPALWFTYWQEKIHNNI